MKLDLTVNIISLVLNIPVLLMVIKMYGDWRIIKNRINMMWKDYCKQHNINDSEASSLII